jgi:hypothetical protein
VLVAHLLAGGLGAPDSVWDLLALAVLAVGYGGAFALAVAGLSRVGRPRLIVAQLLLPLYWLLHSVAALRAGRELLVRPYFWSKTGHGQTRVNRMQNARTPAPNRSVEVLTP